MVNPVTDLVMAGHYNQNGFYLLCYLQKHKQEGVGKRVWQADGQKLVDCER